MALICLFSCSQQKKSVYDNAHVFDTDDFAKTISLEGHTLELDSQAMRPMDIQVYDTLLVTVDVSEEKLIQLYNLKTGKKIGNRINRGQGPDDMIMPRLMANDDNKIQILDMGKSIVYEYETADFINHSNPVPSRKIPFEKRAFIDAQQVANNLISYSYDLNNQLFVYDMDGKKVNEIAAIPTSKIPYTDIEKRDAFYMNFTSDNKDKIVISYCMTDLIEIYDLNGTLQHRLHGPEQFAAHFKEKHTDEVTTSSPEKNKNRDAYFSPRNAGDSFFVLYDGTYTDDDSGMSCKQLFSFSWNGNPKNIYNLSDPLITYAVDRKNKKIYGISDSPEFHIVSYDY